MKKIILTSSIALSLLFATASCNNDDYDDRGEITITAAQLPEVASTLVSTHFPGITYALIKKQNNPDNDGSLYDVYLTNGFEMDFDSSGNLVDIDGHNQAIPNELIHKKMSEYVSLNYPNLFITSIDNERTYTEIELINGVELVFDLQGNFIRIDK